MPKRVKRDEEHDTAKAEYIERRSRGEKVSLRELAERLGVAYSTLRNWKTKEKWDELPPPKKKRGGQPGNKNSKGKKNASGSHKGAPPRNKNAEKDGAYSTVYFDMLTEDERELMEQTPMEVGAALEHEMKILKYRERKIMKKITEYENAAEDAMFLSSKTEIKSTRETTMRFSDSAFKRIESLQEALYKVQGRIAKITDSLRAMKEFEVRMELENRRLEVMKVRATGVVETPDEDEQDDVPGMELEDVKDWSGSDEGY